MSNLRLLHFAATAAIAVLHGSVLDKWNSNVYKVNAQPEPTDIQVPGANECVCDAVSSANLWSELPEKAGAMCRGPMSSTPVKTRQLKWAPSCECEDSSCHNPNISDVDGFDFAVCRNYRGVPNWTLQRLSADMVCESDHHSCSYCTSIRFPCMEVSRRDLDSRVNIEAYCDADVDPCVFQLAPPRVERCEVQNNSLWDDFYHYVLFLAQKYENIYVCSAPFFKKRKVTAEEKHLHPGCDTVTELTHFFKVILTEDRWGLFRFDCYMIENKPIAIEHPDLQNYRKMKILAEVETCLDFFPEIQRRFIGSRKVHTDFCPHRFCSYCFPTSLVIQSGAECN